MALAATKTSNDNAISTGYSPKPKTHWDRQEIHAIMAPITFPFDIIMSTAIVIPCYNEELRLSVPSLSTFLHAHDEITLILVNDASSDNTLTLLKELSGLFPSRIQIMCNQNNFGKAESVRRGINKALEQDFHLVGFFDADLATPLSEVLRFRHLLETSPDLEVVTGARVKLIGRDIRRSPFRHYIGRIFATVVSNLLGIGVYDTQCGAKLFKKTDDIRKVFATPFISKWIFDVEILARLIRLKGSHTTESYLYEMPLERWHDIAGSKLKPKDFFLAVCDLWKIYRRYSRP